MRKPELDNVELSFTDSKYSVIIRIDPVNNPKTIRFQVFKRVVNAYNSTGWRELGQIDLNTTHLANILKAEGFDNEP